MKIMTVDGYEVLARSVKNKYGLWNNSRHTSAMSRFEDNDCQYVDSNYGEARNG